MKWLKDLFAKKNKKEVPVGTLSDVLFVCVRKKHYVECTEYADGKGCPMALALKEMFPDMEVLVGSNEALIDGVRYGFDYKLFAYEFVEDRIKRHREGDWTLPSYDVVKLVKANV